MKIDLEVANDCFQLNPLLPGGLIHSLHRPRSYFKDPRKYKAYISTYAGKAAGRLQQFDNGKYWIIKVNGFGTSSHRVIWMLSNQEYIPDGMIVDHRDGNTENNLPSNLRICLPFESSRNRTVQSNNVTGLKGVVYDPSRKSRCKYIAKISTGRKTSQYLGIFMTPEEAHQAYIKAANRLHKEYART